MKLEKNNFGSYRDTFLKDLEMIHDSFTDLENINSLELEGSAALVYVDIVKGFCSVGALSSKKVSEIIPYVKDLSERLSNFQKIFLMDHHEENSVEFLTYPGHCQDDEEKEIVDELREFYEDETSVIFRKNSTNGFLAKGFKEYIERAGITEFIVVGDVTDICVLQFTLTLKAYFNEINKRSRIIVPIKGIETFDLEVTNHDAMLMNLFSLYNMRMNGIEIVGDIDG